MHHEWTAPISVSAIYCHPMEHFFVNMLSLMSGPVLLGNVYGHHIISVWCWVALTTGSSSIYHSGYHLPFMASPESHDYHHRRYNQHFGALGIFDYLHGTNKDFRKSEHYKRDFVLLGLTPAKQLIPSRN